MIEFHLSGSRGLDCLTPMRACCREQRARAGHLFTEDDRLPFLDQPIIKPVDRLLLDFLRSKGGALARGCWWRQKKIAEELSMSLRTVQRHLSKLESLGLIRIQHRQATTNLYFVAAAPARKIDVGVRQFGIPFYRTESQTPKEKQHHPDDVELRPEEAAIADLAQVERKPAVREVLGELQRSGVSLDVIRAGVLLGRARRAASGIVDPVRSLRYYAGCVAEAKKFPAGYAEYLEDWLKRKGA